MTEGLDHAEVLVLEPLEAGPLALWELRWHDGTTLPDLRDIARPGLISLAARELIEVRRFRGWPQPWDAGTPIAGEDLARMSERLEVWSGETASDVLAACLTEAGVHFL